MFKAFTHLCMVLAVEIEELALVFLAGCPQQRTPDWLQFDTGNIDQGVSPRYLQAAMLVLAVFTHRLATVLAPGDSHRVLTALTAWVAPPALRPQLHGFYQTDNELVLWQGFRPGARTCRNYKPLMGCTYTY